MIGASSTTVNISTTSPRLAAATRPNQLRSFAAHQTKSAGPVWPAGRFPSAP
jgi:hypothetical protein